MKRNVWRHGAFHAVALASLLSSVLVASSAGAAAGAPSAPRAVHARGTATSISVSWARPASSGASAIREYVVTSRPSSKSCVTRSTSCVVEGLTPGSPYTFGVVAKNSRGASAAATSNRVKVSASKTYFESSLGAFSDSSSAAESALANATTAAQQQKELKALTDSFNSFISSLTREKWPASTATDMANFVTDTRALASDTASSLEASSSTAAEDFDSLQAITNKEVLVESSVFGDLGLSAPIVASI
ncbi:MAG TPA: fibronectin type III domain-containing protein, partial [Acidimicrobiales bacterium]|nr:fibronectin type III domain-containing protein [Acidimicrobiales bacterium]